MIDDSKKSEALRWEWAENIMPAVIPTTLNLCGAVVAWWEFPMAQDFMYYHE